MAEFVEFRVEGWVSELESMERIQLFDSKEIKSIATKRKELEYKIQRRTKCKEDFLKYIQFEIDLHRIIKARREKTGIKNKVAEIDHSQTQRIAHLFKQAIFKFPNDVKLWMSLFKFCKGVKFHSLISQMLVRMLQIHSDKPDLWVFAAIWEFKQCKSITNARQFLTKALRHHPSSSMLYQELFKLELIYMRQIEREIKKKKEMDEEFTPDKILTNIREGKVAQVVYESAVKSIEGVDIKVSLLNIAKKEKAPLSLKKLILHDLIKNNLNEEVTWNAIAKMELSGVEVDVNEIIVEENPMIVDEKEKKLVSEKDRIHRSVGVYEEGIKRMNTEKMWGFYLNFVFKLNKNVKSLPVFKWKVLSTTMEGALKSGKMSERHYLEWTDKLEGAGKRKKLEEAYKRGTEDHPRSPELWYGRLRFYLSSDQENLGVEVFNQAVDKLGDAGAPVWSLMVKYLMLKSSPKAGEILLKGVKQGGEVGQTLKPLYLEWLTQSKGINEARKVFETPEMNLPPSLKVYRKMADLELSQNQVDVAKVRKCHELACSRFGTEDIEVWLEFIRFELNKGNPLNVSKVHRRALKSLDPKIVDEFIVEFNNIKTKTT